LRGLEDHLAKVDGHQEAVPEEDLAALQERVIEMEIDRLSLQWDKIENLGYLLLTAMDQACMQRLTAISMNTVQPEHWTSCCTSTGCLRGRQAWER
jgi:hypothetical protein